MDKIRTFEDVENMSEEEKTEYFAEEGKRAYEASRLLRQMTENGNRRRAAIKPLLTEELYGNLGNPETIEGKIEAIESISSIKRRLDDPYYRERFFHERGIFSNRSRENYLSALEEEVMQLHFYDFLEMLIINEVHQIPQMIDMP